MSQRFKDKNTFPALTFENNLDEDKKADQNQYIHKVYLKLGATDFFFLANVGPKLFHHLAISQGVSIVHIR